MLSDDSHQIKIKLWDTKADLVDENFLHLSVIVKNVGLDRYEGKNTLGSTPETEIIVSICQFLLY